MILDSFSNGQIQHVNWEANRTAHILAQVAIKNAKFWWTLQIM
jgi:hypothetical protein